MTILLHWIFLFAGASQPLTPIPLAIGESHTIQARRLQTVQIQKKGILSYKDQGGQLIFVGKKLGGTKVILGDRTYLFKVLPKRRFQSIKQLQRWLIEKRGPKVSLITNKPTISGRLLVFSDFTDLTKFTTEQSEFQWTALVSPHLKVEIQSYIEQQLTQNNLSLGELNFAPKWEYKIGKKRKAQLGEYKKILAPLGIKIKVDSNNLTDQPVIKIQLYIAHIKKSFLRQWGLQWPGQMSLQLQPTSGIQWNSFQVALNALETNGQGKILATPTLVTESGSSAEFHSGGEFPIRTNTQFNNTLQWKKHGLFLNVKPTANAKKHLKIKVDVELSTLDQTQIDVEVPSINRSHVKTQINLKSPRPILLSGLIKQTQNEGRTGIPWLQQIPIFKPLFSTSQIYDDNYELLFILIPSFYE